MNAEPNPGRAPAHDEADRAMHELLDQASRRAWTGPDHSPRVEEHLKGITMNARTKLPLSRTAMLLIGVGALAGGSLAAAVTHSVLSHRATLITDDGTRYDVELTDTPEGAAGTFVTDDGTVYGIEMIEAGGQKNVTVDIDSPNGGTSTILLDNGMAPRVTTAPGQTARIQITETTSETEGKDDAAEDGSDE